MEYWIAGEDRLDLLAQWNHQLIRDEGHRNPMTVAQLREPFWPRGKRLTVEVLTENKAGIAFWQAVGYRDYCLTLTVMPEK